MDPLVYSRGYIIPMAKLQVKVKAIGLRRSGLSCIEIAEQLNISKETVSIWCRDIQLSSEEVELFIAKRRDARNRGRLMGANTNRELREQRVREAEQWAKGIIGNSLSERDVLLTGIGLYWGEGAKGRKLTFTNSSPDILFFIKKWFELVLAVPPEDFLVRVYINEAHRERYATVKSFWMERLSLPGEQFYEPTFLKTRLRKVYENHETYYGVVALRIRKSTALQNKILGLVRAVNNAGVAQW